jgi:hypothetical protein
MTVIATFSNGFTDEYKGKRDVQSAWAIFNIETGRCHASGHSLTAELATKNGNTNMRLHQMPSAKHAAKYYTKEDITRIKAENTQFKAEHKLEIVPIDRG